MRLPDKMYFGNKERMTWVRAPDASFEAGKEGWSNSTAFLNGGAFVQRSTAAAKTYNLAWTMMSREEIRAITDYSDGMWGDGPFYFLDPMAMDTNLLPQHWAIPRQVLKDAPVLSGGARSTVPQYGVDFANGLGYPTKGVIYSSISAAATTPKLWVPIPPGYTAWFGAHGVAGAQNLLQITASDGSITKPVLLNSTDPTRFNYSFNGNSYSSISLALDNPLLGTLVINAMMLQILPNGVTPATGGFISGQGNSGVRFDEQPALTNVSAALDKATVTATFKEDEAWR